jgi:anti-anti-sigma regulatory factor
MPTQEEIREALHASRVVPLGVAKQDGPLGLEHLAAAVARVNREGGETLAITLRPETRMKLEQLARAEGEATARPVTVEEVVAAIVEQFVSATPFP